MRQTWVAIAIALSSCAFADGLTWHEGMPKAIQIAKAENKPILALDLFGRWDDEFC